MRRDPHNLDCGTRRQAVSAWRLLVAGLLVPLALAGCMGSSSVDDLRDFMAEAKAKPGGVIDPLPEFAAYEPFAYGAVGLRNPFEAPVKVRPRVLGASGKEVKPDLTRPKQYLEQFNVIDLKMVGTLNRPGEFYGLVKESTGGVHRVQIGDYVGQNYGKITGINETQIELTEIITDGVGGWLERNRVMRLGGGETEP